MDYCAYQPYSFNNAVLTPESVASEWCQWEFAQAVHMGKKVVTVLLAECELDGVLGDHQYIDFTRGDSLEVGLRLGTAVFAAQPIPPELVPLRPAPDDKTPERQITHNDPPENALVQQLYAEAYRVYRAKAYEEALELLEDLLHIAPQHDDAQKLLVLTERRLGVRSRPGGRAARPRVPRAPDILPPPFAWVEIPAGQVEIEDHGVFDVPRFEIAKYPITNAQYAKFIDAGGYAARRWWTDAGWRLREEKDWTEPRYWDSSDFNGTDQPVVGVSWYEAVAFCLWLSEATGQQVMLPTEQQWQRAAQGDDGRTYPWGNAWDATRCNTHESDIGKTTPVQQYEGRGDSPFGVVDMAGNVWEWCLTDYDSGANDAEQDAAWRVLRGCAFTYARSRARAAARGGGNPGRRSVGLGFRVVCARPPS